MVYADDYGCYVEDRGCYYALLHKIRENRRMIVVLLLLAVVVASVVAGFYNGVTMKEYSNWAVTVGLFFPSIILIFICIYVAFTCGRASISSTMLPSVHHLQEGNESHFYEHAARQLQGSPATLRARCQSKHFIDPIDDSLKSGIQYATGSGLSGESDDSLSNYAPKRHFRSLSNSDISRYRDRYIKTLDRGYERPASATCREDYGRCSKSTRCQDVPRGRGFKRCVSDKTHKYRNAKYRENNTTRWRVEAGENARRCVDKQFSTNSEDQTGSDCLEEIFEQPVTHSPRLTHQLSRYNQTFKNHEKMMCYEFMNGVAEKRNLQGVCAGEYSPKSIGGKNWIHHLTKPDVPRFYPSCKMDKSQQSSYPFNFPYVSSTERDFRDSKSASDCSFAKSEQKTFLSDLPTNDKRLKYIFSQQDNALNENLKRKAIYGISKRDRESIRSLSVHASENCKYFPEKIKMVETYIKK